MCDLFFRLPNDPVPFPFLPISYRLSRGGFCAVGADALVFPVLEILCISADGSFATKSETGDGISLTKNTRCAVSVKTEHSKRNEYIKAPLVFFARSKHLFYLSSAV